MLLSKAHDRLTAGYPYLLMVVGYHPQLPEAARDRIADPETAIFVSAASIWEIGIKRAIRKLEAPREIMAFIEEVRILRVTYSDEAR